MSEDHSADRAPAASLPIAIEGSLTPGREQQLLHQAGEVIQNLRSQMAELDRREQNLSAQTAALENERRRLRLSAQEFDDQVALREESLKAKESALAKQVEELEQQQRDLDRHQREFQEQERARKEELERGRDSIAAELEEYRQKRRATLDQELRKLAETVAAQQTEWERECAERERQFETESAAQNEQLAQAQRELEDLRAEKLGEIEAQETELQRKQIELEKRTRLHESHLNQLRRTVEQQQADCDRAQQLCRTDQMSRTDQLTRYRQQLLRARDRLTQREESIERERRLIDDLRVAIQSREREQQQRWNEDRQSWNEECEACRADIRRQQDMLTLHARNLEARRSRLDQLRDDLERTHRETLEIRVAVEEVWGNIAESLGDEEVEARVQQRRAELNAGYEQIRASLLDQRTQIDAAEHRLAEQRQRFRSERQEFTEWMGKHELDLQQREELLQRDLQLAADREAEWRTTRERWTLEKIEAESVIRQLLEELDADLSYDESTNTASRADSGEKPSATAA